ncbi:MAG: orotidine-5'-phosphate decarboxylase [Coriobacteriia bacterium]|nr:orotidine-5'-phosphate decarboxylase [Coriobacteriia bacterium]
MGLAVTTGGIREKIIVALDTDAHTALGLARSLQGRAGWLKVGMTLYYAEGPDIVARLRGMGFSIFLDLKLHDIPHQVESAAREIAKLGCAMMTVHASGGVDMMRAAVQGACAGSGECGIDTPDIVAVTVLTSLDERSLGQTGVSRPVAEQVRGLAALARESGVQGIVCSPHEARAMRELLGPEALVVTPGVRPSWASADDQARVATPAEAIAAGASHVVIGRPITGAEEPGNAIERIAGEA